MGVLLTVAITLIVGGAVFSYVNGEATVSENRYGQAVAGSVDSLNERFVVADMAYACSPPPSPQCTSVSFYLYNNGQIALQLTSVLLYDSTHTQMSYDCTSGTCATALTGLCSAPASVISYPPSSPPIGSTMTPIPIQGNPVQFTISLPSGCTFVSGTTYYLNILGVNGNDVIYYSVK
jgi:hypothetical protein